MSDKPKCCARVWGGYKYFPCGNQASIQVGGEWFCGKHNPEAKAMRQAQSRAKRARETELRNAKSDVDRLRNEVIEAARNFAKEMGPFPSVTADNFFTLAVFLGAVKCLEDAESKLAALEAQQ